MIFSIAFDFAIEIVMNDTPQGDGNLIANANFWICIFCIRMNDTP